MEGDVAEAADPAAAKLNMPTQAPQVEYETRAAAAPWHEAEDVINEPEMRDGKEEDWYFSIDQSSWPNQPSRTQENKLAPFLGAVLVFLLAATGLLVARGALKPLSPLSLDAEAVLGYEDKFNDSVTRLEEAWQKASEPVRKAFVKNFVPSINDEETQPDGLAPFRRLIEGMHAAKRPANRASTGLKWSYATQLQLTASICNAATLRIWALAKLENQANSTGIAVPILGRPESKPLPSDEQLKNHIAGVMPFHLFAKKLDPRAMDPSQAAQVEGVVPKVLAERLAKLVEAHDTFTVDGKYLYLRFNPFLGAYGISVERMADSATMQAQPPLSTPYDETPFDTQEFLRFLHYRYNAAASELRAREMVRSCAEDWTVSGVRNRINQLGADIEGRMANLIRQKREIVRLAGKNKPLPPYHLFALAIFLL